MGSSVAIRSAAVVDGTGGIVRTGHTVLVENGRFSKIGPDGSFEIPAGVDLVDGTGKWLIPGFVNGNVHLLDGIMMMGIGGIEYLSRWEGQFHEVCEEAAQLALKAGCTTVFDTWNGHQPVLTARDRINAGAIEGPRIFAAGNIVGMGGPFSLDFNHMARSVISKTFADRMDSLFDAGVGAETSLMSPTEIRAVIRDYIGTGVDMVKIAISDHLFGVTHGNRSYLTFSERVLRVLAEETKSAGLPLLTHTQSVEAVQLAIDLDADLMIHATLTSQAPLDGDIVDQIVAKGIHCGVQSVTHPYQEKLEAVGHPMAGYGGFQHILNEKMLITADAPIVLGTDAGCTSRDVLTDTGEIGDRERPWSIGTDHFAWARALHQKGMSPSSILQSMTSKVATAYNKGNDLGTVEVGKLGDFLLLDSNPLEDVRNLESIEAIYKEGRLIDRQALPTRPLVTAPIGTC
ncbi:amidohydrolase family protein [Arthrobacter sp. 2RAF6]|uniref:amidohydrolase family protein n=1 Tax=Arthrobacter sp. 2RAF6 TaxID=3233002 RepID=UPI003F8F47B3